MNIFAIDKDPVTAAKLQMDAHIVKMPLETMQLLAMALRNYGVWAPDGTGAPKGHETHPCTIWALRSQPHYVWLAEHGMALCEEYQARYGREHTCAASIQFMGMRAQVSKIPGKAFEPFALAFEREYLLTAPPVDPKRGETALAYSIRRYQLYYEWKAQKWGPDARRNKVVIKPSELFI